MNDSKKVQEFYKKLIKKDSDAMFEGEWSRILFFVNNEIPRLLEKKATQEMWQEYAAFCYMLKRLSFFLFCKELRGKKIVSFGGVPFCGKSTLLRALITRGDVRDEEVLPANLSAYIVNGAKLKFWGLNRFDTWCEYAEDEIKSVRDGLPEGEETLQLDHLLEEVIVITPRLDLSNIVVLDMPGYVKDSNNAYQEQMTGKIVRSHLRNSDFVFWVVAADKGGITEDEIELLSKMDNEIPISFILTKVDTLPFEQIEAEKQKLANCLIQNKIRFKDIFVYNYSQSSLLGTQPIREALKRINNGASSSVSFLREFRHFFALCTEYYEKKSLQAKTSLVEMSKCLMHADDTNDAMTELENVIQIFRNKIKWSLEAKNNVAMLERVFFVELMFLTGDDSFDDFRKMASKVMKYIDIKRMLTAIKEELDNAPRLETTVKQIITMQTDNLGQYKEQLSNSVIGYRLILEVLLMYDNKSDYIERVSEYINYLAKVFEINFRCCDEIMDIYKQLKNSQGQDIFTTQYIPLEITEKILDTFCKQYVVFNNERFVYACQKKFVQGAVGKRVFTKKKIVHFKNIIFEGGESFSFDACDEVIVDNCEFRGILVNNALFSVKQVDRILFRNCSFNGIKKPPTLGGIWLMTVVDSNKAEFVDCELSASVLGIKENIFLFDTKQCEFKVENCKADHGYKFDREYC